MATTKNHIDIGIQSSHSQILAELLNALLADEYVLFTKTKLYHWNVESPNFSELHEFFEEQATALIAIVDEVAERVRQLGFYSAGSLKEFQSLARLPEQAENFGEAKWMLQNLLDDHEAIIKIMRVDLEAAMEEYKDAGTSDLITGWMEQHEKNGLDAEGLFEIRIVYRIQTPS